MKRKLALPAVLAVGGVLCVLGLTGCPFLLLPWYVFIGADEGDDGAFAVTASKDGGYAVAGFAEPAHEESDRALVVKLSDSGLEEWRAEYDEAADEVAKAIAQTADGGYIVAGESDDGTGEARNVFILKLSASGEQEWVQFITEAGINYVRSVAVLPDGGFVVALQTDALGESNVVLEKRAADGTLGWSVVAAQGAHAVQAVATSGGAAIAWWTVEPSELETGTTYSGTLGILEVDDAGAQLSQATVPLDTPLEATGLAVAADGPYVVVGQSSLFDDDSQALVVKVTIKGEILWQTSLGGTGRDVPQDVIVTSSGRIAVVGEDGVPGEASSMFLALLDADGTTLWQQLYGDDRADMASAVVEMKSGGFVLAGRSEEMNEEDRTGHSEMLVICTTDSGESPGIETEETSE